MRASSLFLGLSLGFGAACAPEPGLVSIDLSVVPVLNETTVSRQPQPGIAGVGSQEGAVPAISARTVLVGSGTGLAKDAIAAARRNQERAYRQALAELKDAFLAEARSNNQEQALVARKEFDIRFRSLYGELRVLFEAHAKFVGPLWTRLATIRGFPEKPGKQRLPPESDFVGRAEAKEATAIRKTISDADLDYRTEVSRRVEGLRQEWRAVLTELEANRIVALDAAEVRAGEEAKKMVTEAMKNLEQSLIQDIERLPGVPGAKVTMERVEAPKVDIPEDPGPDWKDTDRMRQRAGLFARTKGYRLVQPGPGVRDVTKEFVAWQNKELGR